MANKRIIRNGGLIFIITVVSLSIYWFYTRLTSDQAPSNTPTIDNNSTVSIQISNNIPDLLSKIVKDVAKKEGWEISDNKPDIVVKSESDDKDAIPIYLFFVVVKPYSKIAEEDGKVINKLSDGLNTEIFEAIDQDSFTLDTSSNTDYELVTFAQLNGTKSIVKINNKSVFDKSWWENKSYPLTLTYYISGNERVDEFVEKIGENNDFITTGFTFDYPKPNDFVEIIKTGTTVAGGPGWQLCERTKGNLSYPINEVKDVMSEADISMISNESSFVPGCTQAAGTTSFCGKPAYIQNLLDMGIDIVSLTGNHMNDYGRDYFVETLQTYLDNDIKYFASGNNNQEAWEPLVVETNAGKIAFMGYNRMGPDGMIATDDLAGTAYYDQTIFLEKLDEVADNVDIVWLDTHLWPEFGTTPTQEQISLTQLAVDNGVDVVTGVSSHEPLGMTFYKEKPVFYGLSNFLFDQMWSPETRLSLVVRAYMYNGKIIDLEILPTRMYDYCQPRFLEGSDKKSILEYFVGISDL